MKLTQAKSDEASRHRDWHLHLELSLRPGSGPPIPAARSTAQSTQHLGCQPALDPISYSRNTEWPFGAAGLWDHHPPHGSWLIRLGAKVLPDATQPFLQACDSIPQKLCPSTPGTRAASASSRRLPDHTSDHHCEHGEQRQEQRAVRGQSAMLLLHCYAPSRSIILRPAEAGFARVVRVNRTVRQEGS
jgi:hypothetical protein